MTGRLWTEGDDEALRSLAPTMSVFGLAARFLRSQPELEPWAYTLKIELRARLRAARNGRALTEPSLRSE